MEDINQKVKNIDSKNGNDDNNHRNIRKKKKVRS